MTPVDCNGRAILCGTIVENPDTGRRLRVLSLDELNAKTEWVSGPGREFGDKIEFGFKPGQCGWVVVR